MVTAMVSVVCFGIICVCFNGAGPDTEDDRSVNDIMGDE